MGRGKTRAYLLFCAYGIYGQQSKGGGLRFGLFGFFDGYICVKAELNGQNFNSKILDTYSNRQCKQWCLLNPIFYILQYEN